MAAIRLYMNIINLFLYLLQVNTYLFKSTEYLVQCTGTQKGANTFLALWPPLLLENHDYKSTFFFFLRFFVGPAFRSRVRSKREHNSYSCTSIRAGKLPIFTFARPRQKQSF